MTSHLNKAILQIHEDKSDEIEIIKSCSNILEGGRRKILSGLCSFQYYFITHE